MKNKFSFAITLAVIMSMLLNSLALADNTVADGDGVAQVTNQDMSFGSVCASSTTTKTALIVVSRSGNAGSTNVFKDGSTVTVSVLSVSGSGLSAVMGSNTITLPANWGSQPNNTVSTSLSSTVTLQVGTGSSFSGSITYRASGVNSSNIAITRDDVMNVTATIANCDTTAPSLNLPGNLTAEATGPSGATVTYSASASDTNPLNPTVSCSPASGSTFALGSTTVSCSATDNAGNTANGSFIVTVQDTTAPVVTPPGNITVEAVNASGATVSYSGESAVDLVDGSIAASCSPVSGSVFPLGSNSVLCSATDSHSNTGTSTFNITVQDTTAPLLALSGDITTEATGPAGASVAFSASASDSVDGALTPSCSANSGDTFSLGTTLVSCSATDSSGNTSSGSFNVSVVDTTAPSLDLPDSFSVEATGPSGAAATFSASATDIVDGSVSVLCDANSGDIFPVGATTVSCSATDAAGNTANGSFIVTVQDTTPPSLNLPADQLLEATGPGGAAATFSASANDLVDGPLAVSCDANSGDTFPLGSTTVTCSVSDAAGNMASGSFVIIVEDTTPPTLTVPSDITAEATGPSGAAVSYSRSASDIVDGSVAVDCSPVSGSTFALGTTTVNCSATDAAGNTASDSFDVTVEDTTPPTIALASRLPAANSFGWNNVNVTVTWSCTDLVGVLSPSVDQTVSAEGAGQSATGTCEDTSGNMASDTVSGINIDKTLPLVALVGGPSNGASYYFGSVPAAPTCSASDALSGLAAACSVSGYSSAVGSHTVTASAMDKADNSASASASYSVLAWTLNGFYQPVDMSGVWNTVKGGSTVPLKFEIFAGSELTNTSAVQSVQAYRIACTAGGSEDAIETVTTGGTSLRYDATSGQFIFNWQTPRQPGTCYKVVMTAQDGSTLTAFFKLK
jgi:hypothetical protein